jgi:hypothetical protein
MKRSLLPCALIALFTGIGCRTPPRLTSLRFSDTKHVSDSAQREDTSRTRFELVKASSVHAHLDVAHEGGWRARRILVVCTLTGPSSAIPDVVDRTNVLLPRGSGTTTSLVSFDAPQPSGWVEGAYKVTCTSGESSISGTFELVDVAAMIEKAQQQEPVLIRPRLFSMQTADGPAGPPGDEFDAASLRYVGYEIEIPGTILMYTLETCVFEHVLTGVTRMGSSATELTEDHGLLASGSQGFDVAGFWLPGEYRLRCKSGGVTIEPRTFRVYGRAAGIRTKMELATRLPLPKAQATAIQFMEFGDDPPPVGQREYFTIYTGNPRFIGTEVTIGLDEPAPRNLPFTCTCHYLTDTGQVIGKDSVNVEIPAGQTRYYVWVSWGNRSGTFWNTGTYFAECDINGRLLAGGFFSVQR